MWTGACTQLIIQFHSSLALISTVCGWSILRSQQGFMMLSPPWLRSRPSVPGILATVDRLHDVHDRAVSWAHIPVKIGDKVDFFLDHRVKFFVPFCAYPLIMIYHLGNWTTTVLLGSSTPLTSKAGSGYTGAPRCLGIFRNESYAIAVYTASQKRRHYTLVSK